MGLLDDIKETVVGGDESARTYRYHCRSCDTRFESEERSASQVTCPECGTRNYRKISRM